MAELHLALDDRAARERVARVDVLIEQLETSGPAVPRDMAIEIVQALLDLYGEGMSRVVGHVAARDHDGELARALGGDELVSHLLLLHGLHPVPMEDRVHAALDEVRPYLESHGGDVELLRIEDRVVHLALQGTCNGCASSTVTLKLAIEDAIHKAAPDVEGIEAAGAVAPEPAPPSLLQIEVSDALRPSGGPAPNGGADGAAAGAWAPAGALPELDAGGPVVHEVAGERVLFVSLDGAPYAYRPSCPGCRDALADAALLGAELTCPGCGHRYDVRRAGRCVDEPGLHLEPLPLLVDGDGLVKVALGVPA
jgi:Fe-S cluster biogenesis protein NfuA/nitrite reductase/ring-hydroxylating ferredoxin subunit